MNNYEGSRGKLVEDLINTYDLYLAEPEHLREPADLARFLAAHAMESGEQMTQSLLEQVRQLRTTLRACWAAGIVEELEQRLNPLLAGMPVVIQVEADGNRLPLRLNMLPGATLLQRLTLMCAEGLIILVQNYGLERMRSCDAEPCRDVYVDVSRNNSRRFCSERCASRYNVAAFRGRNRE